MNSAENNSSNSVENNSSEINAVDTNSADMNSKENKPRKKLTMKNVLSAVTTVLLVIVLLLAGALVGVRIFGIAPYTVLSGSMEPTYHVGSLIYVKKVDVADLKVGDPITYVIEGGTVVTHRIVEFVPEYGEDGSTGYRVKGDANKTADGTPVHANNILGKPIFTIPYLGYAAYYIQNPPGSYLAIGACVIIVLLTFLPDLLDKLMGETPVAAEEGSGAEGMDELKEDIKELRERIAKERAKLGLSDESPPGGEDALSVDESPPNSGEDALSVDESPPGG